MPQYFRRRWNLFAQLGVLGAPLYVVGLALLAVQVLRSPYVAGLNRAVAQPIPFSHVHHVGRLRLDCRYCHDTVEDLAFAGMPSTQVCAGCHAQVWTGLAAVEPVMASYQTRIPLAWLRVHNVPDFARFDHSIHVQKGIGCVTCHGRVDQMPQVWQTASLEMEWCLQCHRQPERYVRPREEVFNLAWQPPKEKAAAEELRQQLVKQYGVRRQTSCSNCHQ